MSKNIDHPKYGHLPRCPKDPNKLCDYKTLEHKLASIQDKANDWLENMNTYPDTEVGEYCKTVLKLCRQEILEVLGARANRLCDYKTLEHKLASIQDIMNDDGLLIIAKIRRTKKVLDE